MRCEARTRRGQPCTQGAMAGARVCVSHAGRCGARPGNRNALRHGLYSGSLAPEERLELALAEASEGLDEEIAITRLMILRALREQEAPPETYARLADALCRQLRARRQLSGEGPDSLAAAIATVLDEVGDGVGLGEHGGAGGESGGTR